MGQIAVEVPFPQDEAKAYAVDGDTAGLAAESEAMGSEEFPLLDVGALHGDWLLVVQAQFGTGTLVKFQLSHALDALSAEGGLVVEESPNRGFGPKGGFGEATLTKQDNDALLMTFVIDGEGTDYVMTRDGLGWTPTVTGPFGEPTEVLLLKADDFAASEAALDAMPVAHNLVAEDERGDILKSTVTWTLVNLGTNEQDTVQSKDGWSWNGKRAPGTYRVTASSGDLVAEQTITLARGARAASIFVFKPEGEGADLVLDVSYFCSPNEDCDMEMGEIPIDFTLPVGWGAERPIPLGNRLAMFNMTTNTSEGPFFATLNQQQRSADLGPCFELMTGTFCHEASDDPALLADIAILKRSLSFKATIQPLNKERLDTLLNQLTGDTK